MLTLLRIIDEIGSSQVGFWLLVSIMVMSGTVRCGIDDAIDTDSSSLNIMMHCPSNDRRAVLTDQIRLNAEALQVTRLQAAHLI
jgi:hypothetical protein